MESSPEINKNIISSKEVLTYWKVFPLQSFETVISEYRGFKIVMKEAYDDFPSCLVFQDSLDIIITIFHAQTY